MCPQFNDPHIQRRGDDGLRVEWRAALMVSLVTK